jgi:spermidine/putrescine transport system ATP-binding protein
VVDTNYFGDMTYYDVRLPGSDAPATISMRNTAGRRILREGMKARVGWSPKSLVVLE